MTRSKWAGRLLAVGCGAGCCCCALGGAISVSPTRIALTPDHPIATMEVRNEGSAAVTIQMERMAWAQRDGQDLYRATTELIATPSVFELGPHGSQVLRIAARGGAVSGEHAYRLYATEVPVRQPMSGPGLQMSLRIGVPIFLQSAENSAKLSGAVIAGPDGQSTVQLRNDGGHFSRAIRVDMTDAAGNVLWQTRDPAYVLAGGEYRWPVGASAPLSAAQGLRLSVVTEAGEQQIDVQRLP